MDSDDDLPPSTRGPGSLVVPAVVKAAAAPVVALSEAHLPLEAAYALAREQMAAVRPTAPGYRLFWVRHREVGWMDLPDGGAYAVIGHHDACDARLRELPGIALRHLLATTVRLSDGLALRVLDLQTRFPFHLADGAPRRSLVVCGPLAFRLGEYVIGGVPVEDDEAAPGQLRLPRGGLPLAMVSEGVSLPQSVRPPPAARPPNPVALRGVDMESVTHVTSMLPPSTLGQRRPRGLARPAPPGDDEVQLAMLDELACEGPGCAWVTLRRAGQSVGVELSEGELDRGVVVGRAEGCHEGLKAVLDTNVSRGHLLLLHHHGVFEAFDLCSTQGSYAGGKSVRRFVLPDEGARMQLATKEPVTLEWKRSEAPAPP